MRVSLSNSDRGFSVTPERSLLDAAQAAGLHLPHSCRGGSCGACRARLLTGQVHYPRGVPLGLSAAEAAQGFILLCQAHARGDLVIDSPEIRTPQDAKVKRLPARIERAQRLCGDVLALYLRLPAAEPFDFQPGQYLDILIAGGRRRSFSIASPPHDARLLELHVRRVPGGEFTGSLFEREPQGTLIRIEGPFGQFVYRHAEDMPLLLVGGGTGLAPLKSILRHVIESGLTREIRLYWGVRTRDDLYADAELAALARRAANFRYFPVLSEPDEAWSGRRGWVHAAVLRDGLDLPATQVYASGPPAMIDALREDFVRAGANLDQLFVDPFDYAPWPADRQSQSAATKS